CHWTMPISRISLEHHVSDNVSMLLLACGFCYDTRKMKNTSRRVLRPVAVFWLIAAPWLWQAPQALAQETESLTLTGVVQRVLAAHPLTQAAQARVQTAVGQARQARAYANPSFTFTNNDFTFERTYAFSQPLEWPFKRDYRIGVAES